MRFTPITVLMALAGIVLLALVPFGVVPVGAAILFCALAVAMAVAEALIEAADRRRFRELGIPYEPPPR